MRLRQDVHKTDFQMSFVPAQQTTAYPEGRTDCLRAAEQNFGYLQGKNVWQGTVHGQIHWKHMWPPARWLLYCMLLPDRLWTSGQRNPLWSQCRQPIWRCRKPVFETRHKPDIPAVRVVPFYLKVNSSKTKQVLSNPQKHIFSHVNSLQGSVLLPRQALSLKPVTFDPSPQLTLLLRVSRGSSWHATLL